MHFWDNYPRTDFHELNLDWFLAKFREMENKLNMLLGGQVPDYEKLGGGITVNKQGRYAHRLYVYGSDRRDSTSYPTGMEGFCKVGNSYVMCFKSSNDSVAEIIVLNDNFEIVRRSGYFTNLGHANSMCYYNGLLYIATLDNRLVTVNYSNLTFNAEYTYDSDVHAVAYDAKLKRVVWSDYTAVYDLAGASICSINGLNINTAQGMGAYNDFYYMLQSANNTLLKFDNTGDLIEVIPINAGDLWDGELQDIDIDADQIVYLNGSTRYTRYQYNFSSVYAGKLDGTTAEIDPVFTNLAGRMRTVYVDKNNYQGNPNGSADKPFNYIEEALLFIVSQPRFYGTTQLNLVANSDFTEEILYVNNMFLDIVGNDCTVKFIDCKDCQLSIHNLNVQNDDERYRTIEYNSVTGTLANVDILQSDTEAENDVLFYESIISLGNITGANYILANYSRIIRTSLGATGTVNYINCVSETHGVTYDTITEFVNLRNNGDRTPIKTGINLADYELFIAYSGGAPNYLPNIIRRNWVVTSTNYFKVECLADGTAPNSITNARIHVVDNYVEFVSDTSVAYGFRQLIGIKRI